jgi:hypothetical protein
MQNNISSWLVLQLSDRILFPSLMAGGEAYGIPLQIAKGAHICTEVLICCQLGVINTLPVRRQVLIVQLEYSLSQAFCHLQPPANLRSDVS